MQPLDVKVVEQVLAWLNNSQPVWFCTVLSTWGSSPREPGSLFAACSASEWVGSLAGGCVEDEFLAQLGSPSTTSIFDENTWIYMSELQERVAYLNPKVKSRSIVAIRFGEDDAVEEVVEYDENAGQIVNYASRETPTRGRELGFWEQIFGTIGAVQLPRTDEATPDNPTGRR